MRKKYVHARWPRAANGIRYGMTTDQVRVRQHLTWQGFAKFKTSHDWLNLLGVIVCICCAATAGVYSRHPCLLPPCMCIC